MKPIPYIRPLPLDPDALRACTAHYRAYNDELAARLAEESTTGLVARLAKDNARAEARRR